jgi:hypothetical protein
MQAGCHLHKYDGQGIHSAGVHIKHWEWMLLENENDVI